MAPPTAPLNLDVEAISGICGSISIAAWIVVFSPQIIENFRRNSADGLSLQFVIAWLLGDVFNILGAVLQGVLPTMLILAFYYAIADLVLLLQCFYYRGFTWKDEVVPPQPKPQQAAVSRPDERTSLLARNGEQHERRGSDWSHLSPVLPILSNTPATPPPKPTALQTFLWNLVAIVMVCVAGVAGWFLSRKYTGSKSSAPTDDGIPTLDLWGQIFGWLCAILYLGSRLPQMILNWRRKSTEGVSMLFFLFACLGNLTYVLSIFAYEPNCAGKECQPGEASRIYGRYILVNASWLAGSLGTLILDLGIFAQFFMYGEAKPEYLQEEDGIPDEDEYEEEEEEAAIDERRWDQRPLLERAGSGLP